MSPQRIAEALKAMRVVAIKDSDDSTSFLSLAARRQLQRGQEWMKAEELSKLLKEQQQHQTELVSES